MAMDPCLKATLNQTIYVASRTGTSSYGDSTFGAATARKARVEVDRRLVANPFTGKEEVTSHRIVVEQAIGLNDRIWLPGHSTSDATLARIPKQVQEGISENGSLHHYEVLV